MAIDYSTLRLSIIIPVYNVADYIEKCVDSLEQQDIPVEEYELIIINDGSPDNSKEVVLNLMKQYKNIVFIDQENQGVSAARNAGIAKARAKYLVFIDPDDYVAINSFGRVLESADDMHAQITFLGYKFLNADNSVRKEILFTALKDKVFPGIEAYGLSRGDGTTDPDRSVAILYERAFVNKYDIRYLSEVPYLEDGEFLARVLCMAERCIFQDEPYYIRTTRLGSATNSRLFYSDRAINGFIKAASNLFKFQQQQLLSGSQQQFLNQPVAKFILLAANSSLKRDNAIGLNEVVAALKRQGIDKCPVKGCKNVYKWNGFFYNLSPLVYTIYKFCSTIIKSVFLRLLKMGI